MKKLFLYAAVLCMGFASCSKEFLVPEGELPSWLGESIYEELQNPKSLDGTFNTYLKLIDDLGYAEVLGKTGSKTIFPANDEAFAEFFKDGNNKFGKSSYDQLTISEKSQILFSTMLDNAVLVGNLSSQQNGSGEMAQGRVIKHPTNVSLLQSVEPLNANEMPENNPSFSWWKSQGKSINALYDNTEAPMVHFTGEYMLNNAMTVTGTDNDFYVLTGQEYEDGDAFVFDRKVINSNVTCQNGYIHQLDGVMVNPGNMAQMLRSNSDTKHISRMMDYFAVAYPMGLQFDQEYQQYASGFATQDSVFAFRYLSQNSQGNAKLNARTKGGSIVKDAAILNFDPGWNYFSPASSSDNQAEISAILAATDDVIEDYFMHDGSYIVKNLGAPGVPNDAAHINEHLDAIYNNDPTVFATMLNNIMKPYLSKSVPSKFATVQNDAFEFLNVKREDIARKADGKFNVQIANNGVIYKMSKFFGPELYNSVLGPASIYKDMRIMGGMLNDHQITPGTASTLEADMYYYLLSMKAKYALFVPTDNDNFYYIDPAYINDVDKRALKFIYDPASTTKFKILVQVCSYDPASQSFTPHPSFPSPVAIETGAFNTQIKDMLNYHTVVLPSSQSSLGGNHYYLTKHGGAIYVADEKGSNLGSSTVEGGAQISGNAKKSVVTEIFSQDSPDAKITNGTVYRLNSPIQPTVKTVFNTLKEKSQYNDFFEFIQGLNDKERLDKCGITNLDKYLVFDENDMMAMLGTYNYTLYVPRDMKDAYSHGLPSWEEIDNIIADRDADEISDDERAVLKQKIEKIRNFVLYHIQNNSVFDDTNISSAKNETFYTNELGIAKTLSLSKNGGSTVVNDATTEKTSKIIESNILARDFSTKLDPTKQFKDIDGQQFTYKRIVSSSFVVIHGIDKPLCYNSNYQY